MMQFLSSFRRQPPAERRVDPIDGVSRTLTEARIHYRETHTEEAVEHYWKNECQPSAQFTAMANDPFMAHVQPRPSQPPAAGASSAPNNNPFQSHADNPFVAHSQTG